MHALVPPWSIAILGACVLSACEAEDDRVTTIIDDRAIVTFDRPLCRGDIALVEQTIAHVEDSLDVGIERPVEITLWNRYADVSERCGEGPLGCYIDGEVHALWESLEHEIVHAVAAPLGTPEPLWREGIAVALGGRTHEGEDDVLSLVGLEDSREVDYATAGHFTRWLLEVHGVEGIRALARESSFEAAHGRELAEASVDYETSAPWSYPHWNPCRGEQLPATADVEWIHEVHVGCDDPWSSSEYQSGPTVLRTLDIEQPGTYRLLFTGATMISALVCQLGPVTAPPAGDTAGDIVHETAGLVLPTFFTSDQPHEVQLEPGRLQLAITVEGDEAAVGMELRRIGP